MNAISIFDVEQAGLTVILTPRRDPDELTFEELAESEIEKVFDHLSTEKSKNVVVDCHRIDRCCSSAMGFFIRLSKGAQRIGGRMAFCNMSAHLQAEFEILHLNTFWAICDTRDAAITEVEKPSSD